MQTKSHITRPPFAEALTSWKKFLQTSGVPAELVWVFDENLCFEKDPGNAAGFKLGYQTAFTPPPAGAEQVAYEHFVEVDAPVVWYRLGSSNGRSVCLLLCDSWFESKTETEGFIKRPEWNMLFRTSSAQEIEEVKEKQRWENRLVRDRPLHDLDFSMSLRAVHETLAHGRVLTAYERYALKLLHVWRHWLGDPH
jgi:hypothetical protein